MADAMRKIEQKLKISNFPKDVMICDIGGNWETHVKSEENRRVHCCNSLLDFRDAQRKMNRMLNLKKYVEESVTLRRDVVDKAKMVEEDNREISCNLRDDKIAVAMDIHSIYDVDVYDLVNT
ncbi:uncharacterized protein HKW66_Vig0142410 [Vigna angularis]|uniref:Alphavirus-like MT domain-containing protein n=1 Tax=Phaseolus angularis TaxID=3914 RepID=A0A8T0KGH0_PHAAN|nr:uncharacterized protein HKW66_Vig0142410 [Vigna angularis]